MDITKYEIFLKIIELGSLTKAADELGYTQAGISHILSSIEDDWNLTLLQRDRSGVRLTSNGIKLLPLIRNVCQASRDLEKGVDEVLGLNTGLIRIGVFHSVAAHWLPKIIKPFCAEYPNIDFEVVHGSYVEIERWVKEGRIDMGFLKLPPADMELESIYLGQDNVVAILPEQHPLAACEQFPVEKVQDEPFLLLAEYQSPGNEVTELFDREKIKPNVRFIVKDDYAIISMVESGLGIGLVPKLLLYRTPYRIAIRELSVPAYRRIGIVLRNSRYASPVVQRFLEYICKVTQTPPCQSPLNGVLENTDSAGDLDDLKKSPLHLRNGEKCLILI
jgi:DNA-binding transcriptional LysR family regulator